MNNRITPEYIIELLPGEYCVFPSNTAGVHGKGLALQATKWGAKRGVGFGFSGQTFAIPTRKFISNGKNYKIETLPLFEIESYVVKFMRLTENHDERFLITQIGCGLAGYEPKDIAPMFRPIIDKENYCLPESFWKILKP